MLNGWITRFLRSREQKQIDARNAERRHLCAEYASNSDPLRRGQIIARLSALSGEANLKAAAERIGYELEGIDRRFPQAEAVRAALHADDRPSHLASELKHFRADFCGTTYAEPSPVQKESA